MKIKCLICLFILSMVVLSSCGENAVDNVSTSQFPINPDKIIIGVNGIEKEIVPDDEAYKEIISQINERIEKSGNFNRAALDDHDPDSGKHLSFELRKDETFVEYVYNECTSQKIDMLQSGGSVTAEEINACRVFFSLTRYYHDCFFVGEDADYVSSITIGPLVDNTTLITYIRDLVTQEAASEQKPS